MLNIAVRFAMLVIFLCFSHIAQAQTIGAGVTCSSAIHAEQFVAYTENGSLQAALDEVNTSEVTCGMMQIAYVINSEVKRLPTKLGIIIIFEVTVLGVVTADGLQITNPEQAFIVALAPGREA